MNSVYLLFFYFILFSIHNTTFITLIFHNYSYFSYYYTNRVMWSFTNPSLYNSWCYHPLLKPACNLGYAFLILFFYNQTLVMPFIYSLIDFSFIYPYVSDLISDHNQYKSYQTDIFIILYFLIYFLSNSITDSESFVVIVILLIPRRHYSAAD